MYASVADLRAEGVTAAEANGARLELLLDEASRLIDRVTAWFFEPRLLTLTVSGRGAPSIELPVPPIRVDRLLLGSVELSLDPSELLIVGAPVQPGFDGPRFTRRHGRTFPRGHGNVVDAVLPNGGDIISVPVLGRVAAGSPILADENIQATVQVDSFLLGGARGSKVFALRVSGDSMIDAGILDGDYIFVRKQLEARPFDIVVAMIDGEATVKRYQPKGDVIEFVPEELGDWAMHCHMTHHVMTQMGHGTPPVTGADMQRVDRRMRRVMPEYLTMGTRGMGGMGEMEMPIPPNSLPMRGAHGPASYVDMGGMFTVLKVLEQPDGADPRAWFQHPAGTVAGPADAAQMRADGVTAPAPARARRASADEHTAVTREREAPSDRQSTER